MFELTALRELDHQTVDRILDHRSDWQRRRPNFGGSWRSRREINDSDRANCHTLCDYLLKLTDYKLVISSDWGYLYANDLDKIREMETLGCLSPVHIKKSVQDRPRDTLLIRNSKHEYRSYFRAGRLEEPERTSLLSYLSNQQDLRISPGLQSFINKGYTYLDSNGFVDHNTMGEIMMLNLIRPRAIRKTVKLIRDK